MGAANPGASPLSGGGFPWHFEGESVPSAILLRCCRGLPARRAKLMSCGRFSDECTRCRCGFIRQSFSAATHPVFSWNQKEIPLIDARLPGFPRSTLPRLCYVSLTFDLDEYAERTWRVNGAKRGSWTALRPSHDRPGCRATQHIEHGSRVPVPSSITSSAIRGTRWVCMGLKCQCFTRASKSTSKGSRFLRPSGGRGGD